MASGMSRSLAQVAALAIVLASSAPAMAQSGGGVAHAGVFDLESLPPQKLRSGQCGLFLWSRTDQPVFVVFAEDTPAQATVRIGGRNRLLKRTATGGERVMGHFEQQTFSAGRYAFDLSLSFDRTRPVQDGAIVDHGVLRTRDKTGEETIVPVGGMIGCQKS